MTAAPCVECGTRHGPIRNGRNRPSRSRGCCDTCYHALWRSGGFDDEPEPEYDPDEIDAAIAAIRGKKIEAQARFMCSHEPVYVPRVYRVSRRMNL